MAFKTSRKHNVAYLEKDEMEQSLKECAKIKIGESESRVILNAASRLALASGIHAM